MTIKKSWDTKSYVKNGRMIQITKLQKTNPNYMLINYDLIRNAKLNYEKNYKA